MAYPYTWEKFEDPRTSMMVFNSIKCKEDGLIMPENFDKMGVNKRVYNFEVRDDDIFLITYPKCGTTWSQELIWGLVSGIDPEVKDMEMFIRSPFLEMEMMTGGPPEDDKRHYEEKSLSDKCRQHSLEYAAKLKSPRVIKTHIPLSHLPTGLLDKAKVVYVARDPRDVLVSYFHFMSIRNLKPGTTLKQFFDLFKDGFLSFGNYFSHLNEHWRFKGHKNFQFIWYEEMKEDVEKVVVGLENFLGYTLGKDKRKQLIERSSIDSMRERAIGNAITESEKAGQKRFFRKGITKDWVNHFTTDEDRNELQEWLKDGLKGTDIELYHN